MFRIILSVIAMAFAFAMTGCQNTPVSSNEPVFSESPAAIQSSVLAFESDTQKVVISAEDQKILADESLRKTAVTSSPFTQLNETRLKYFAMAVAKALVHPGFAGEMKRLFGKKFDGEYDMLWGQISNTMISNATVRSLIESRISEASKSLVSMSLLEQISLLNISLPINFEKWDGVAPVLVAYYPLTIDDQKWMTIKAYDANLKEYTLDAKNAPAYPVIVVGINERCDPATKEVTFGKNESYKAFLKDMESRSAMQKKALNKSTAAMGAVPGQHIFLEWVYSTDNKDAWPLGDGEWTMGWITDGNSQQFYDCNFDGDNDMAKLRWYNPHVSIGQAGVNVAEKIGVKFWERDGNDYTLDANVYVDLKGAVNFSQTQKLKAGLKVDNADDQAMGGVSTTFSTAYAAPNYSRADHTTNTAHGCIQFVPWWGETYVDGVITTLNNWSYTGTLTGAKDRWPVQGSEPTVYGCPTPYPDRVFHLRMDQAARVQLSTNNSGTNFDTKMEVFGIVNGQTSMSYGYNDNLGSNIKSTINVYLPIGEYVVVVSGKPTLTGQACNFSLTAKYLFPNPDKWYKIVLKANSTLSLAINPTAPITNRSNIQVLTYSSTTNKNWKVQYNSDNSCYLVSRANTSLVADVCWDAPIGNGTNVHAFTNSGSTNQKWWLDNIDGTFYKLSSLAANTMFLNANNLPSLTNGSNVQVYQWGGGANEQWQFVEVP